VIFGFARLETKMAARKEQLALDLEDLAENCQQFKWNKAQKNTDCLNFSAGYERSPLFRSLTTKPRNAKASTSYYLRELGDSALCEQSFLLSSS